MAGGDAAGFEAAKPVLDAFGSTVAHVGPPGAGQVVKAANQLLVALAVGLGATAAQRMGAPRARGTAAWATARCASSSRRCPAVGRRERQPVPAGRPAPQPHRRPGAPARVKHSGTAPASQGSARFPREMEERND
jgi:3-hydroxyisobutyrate dehydrogenase-like beta-hydroxyacid dehydrogenase